jgi:hypothetical protein
VAGSLSFSPLFRGDASSITAAVKSPWARTLPRILIQVGWVYNLNSDRAILLVELKCESGTFEILNEAMDLNSASYKSIYQFVRMVAQFKVRSTFATLVRPKSHYSFMCHG